MKTKGFKRVGVAGILVLALIIAFSALTLTACNKNEGSVKSIAVDTASLEGYYAVNEFDISQIKLLVEYENGESNIITATKSMLTKSAQESLKTAGKKSVTIYYKNKTATLDLFLVEDGSSIITVTFNNASGSKLETKYGLKGETITPPDPPSIENQVFVGWVDAKGVKYDLGNVQESVTLTAVYAGTKIAYTVTFFDHNGKEISSLAKNEGSKLYEKDFPDVSISKYPELEKFSWSISSFPYDVEKDTVVTMVPVYKTYSVMFTYAIEGDESNYRYVPNCNVTAKYGQSVKNELGNATKWLKDNGYVIEKTPTDSTDITKNTEFRFIVSDPFINIKVYKDAQMQNLCNDISVKSGTEFTFPAKEEATVIVNKVFTKWMLVGSDSEKTYYAGEKWKVTAESGGSELIFIPVYSDIEFTVTFNLHFTDFKNGELTYVIIYPVQMKTGDVITQVFVDNLLDDIKNNADEYEKLFAGETVTGTINQNAKEATFDATQNKITQGKTDMGNIAFNNGFSLCRVLETTYREDGTIQYITVKSPYYVTDAMEATVQIGRTTAGLEYNPIKEGDDVIGYELVNFTGSINANIYIPDEHTATVGESEITAPVTKISAKLNGNTITYISANTKEISESAFENAFIYGDTVLNNVKVIGDKAFKGAHIYGNMKFGALEEMGESVFENAVAEGDVTIDLSKDAAEIASAAASEGEEGTTVILSLKANTFKNFTGYAKIIIPETVTEIGESAFENSKVGSLVVKGNDETNGIYLPNVISVGKRAFFGTEFDSIDLPSVTALGEAAFADMKNLVSVSITAIVNKEDAFALDASIFEGSTSIKELNLGKGINGITNTDVLGSMIMLDTIVVDAANPALFTYENVLYAYANETETTVYSLIYYANNKQGEYKPVLPESSKLKVYPSAFNYATVAVLDLSGISDIEIAEELTTGAIYAVIIKEELTDSARDAFVATVFKSKEESTVKYDVETNIVYIIETETIDGKEKKSVKVIGGNKYATEITVPASFENIAVTEIEDGAFKNFESLTKLTVEAKLKGWSAGILSGCVSLKEFSVAGWIKDSDNKINVTVEDFKGNAWFESRNIIYVGALIGYNNEAVDVMGNSLTVVTAEDVRNYFGNYIPEKFFVVAGENGENICNITEIYIPDTIKVIGGEAFNGCANLVKVETSAIFTSVGEKAFADCTKLKEIKLDFGGTGAAMGASVFYGCSSLEKATLNGEVNKMTAGGFDYFRLPARTFYLCEMLKEFNFDKINRFAQTDTGASEAFYNCRSFENFDFAKIKGNNIPDSAFAGSGIRFIDFTKATSIITVGASAFSGSSLEYVKFGSSLNKVEASSFDVESRLIVELPYGNKIGLYTSMDAVSETAFNENAIFYYSKEIIDTSANFLGGVANKTTDYPIVAVGFLEDTMEEGVVLQMNIKAKKLYFEESDLTPPVYTGYSFAGWYLANDTDPVTYTKVEFPMVIKQTGTIKFFAKYYKERQGLLEDSDVDYIYYVSSAPELVTANENDFIEWHIVKNDMYDDEVSLWPHIEHGVTSEDQFKIYALINKDTPSEEKIEYGDIGEKGFAIVDYTQKEVVIPDIYNDEENGEDEIIVVYAGAFSHDGVNISEFKLPAYTKAVKLGYYEGGSYVGGYTFGNDMESVDIPETVEYIDNGVFTSPYLETVNFIGDSKLINVTADAFYGSAWWKSQFEKAVANNGFIVAGNVALQFVGSGTPIVISDENKSETNYIINTNDTLGFVKDDKLEKFMANIGIYLSGSGKPVSSDVEFVKETSGEIFKWVSENVTIGGIEWKFEFGFNAIVNNEYQFIASQETNTLLVRKSTSEAVSALMIKTDYDKEVFVPAGIIKIADKAFEGNTEINTLVVNKELVYIGDRAFANSGLEEIRYGETNNEQLVSSISEVGTDAFFNTKWYDERENVILGKIYLKYNNIGGSESVTVTDKVVSIASGAFKGVTLEAVNLASVDTLEEICAYAFADSNINRIELPSSVKVIGRGAFMNCANLINADLSKVTMEELPQDLFRGATGLKMLSLNNSFKTFGKDSLTGCINLDTIIATGITEIVGISGTQGFECGLQDTAWYNTATADADGFLTLGSVLVKYSDAITEGPIEENSKKTIAIGGGITSIARYAFVGALDERLTYTIEIGSGVKSVGESAFAGNVNIEKVIFENGLLNIEKRAFENCSGLKEAVLPEGLEYIGDLAFFGTSLTTVVKDDNGIITEDNGYTIPDSVKEIGESAFENVNTFTSLNLGGKLEMIGHKAFYSEAGGLYKVNWNLDIVKEEVVVDGEKTLSPADKLHQNMIAKNEEEPGYLPSTIFVSANDIRFYASNEVAQYVNNTFKIWGPNSITNNGGYGWNFFETGSYPLVSFTNDNYNIQAFSAEYIKEGDIGIPVHDTDKNTSYTFMGWEIVIDADSGLKKPLEYPYSVYNEITLDAKWYRNTAYPMLGGTINPDKITETSEISCDDGSKITEMSIDTVAKTVTVNKIILGDANQKILYLPDIVSNDNGSGNASAVSYKVIGFADDLVINAPAGSGVDTTENIISQIEEIVLTNASNFSGMTENIFSAFTGLKEVSLYTIGSAQPDYKIIPTTVSTEFEGEKITHTFYAVYSNDTASNTAYGTKLIAFIGNMLDAVPVDPVTGEKRDATAFDMIFEIPQGVTEICSKALINSGFKTVSLPASLTKIGDMAFGKELSKLRIARAINLTDVKFTAFDIDSPIRTNAARTVSYSNYIDVESIATVYRVGSSDYGRFYSIANAMIGYETGITNYSEFVMPDEINGFRITVLSENIYLGKITTDSMGNTTAEKGNTAIKTAYLTLPVNLIKISAHAFDDFDITTSVTYKGSSLTDMDGNVFGDCSFYMQSNGAMYLGRILVKWNDATGNVIVDNGTVSISSDAFNGSNASKITLPESLVNISNNAFYGSTSLREINIPNSVTQIGSSAFQNCTALTTVNIDTINSGLNSLGNNAFYKCRSLKELRLPYNLKSIGENAFSACTSLTTITFDGYKEVTTEQGTIEFVKENDKLSKLEYLGASAFTGDTALTRISIPNNVTAIKKSTFASCTSLVYVEFDITNSNLETIEAQAFMGCSKLGSALDFDANDEDSIANVNPITLNLPNRLVKVEEQAFQNCSGLWGVQFNYHILEIGNNAFKGCDSLIKVNIFRSTVPTIYADTFTLEGSKYRLRIYVNIGEDRSIVKKYEAQLPMLKGYIHEREEKPTVNYLDSSNNVAKSVNGEIIISPAAVIDGTNVLPAELVYYKFESYVEVPTASGDTMRELRDTTETCVGERSGKKVSDYTVPYIQGDQKGYMHTDGKVYTILVVDYEIISLKKGIA